MDDTKENVEKLIADGKLDEALAMTNRIQSGNAIVNETSIAEENNDGTIDKPIDTGNAPPLVETKTTEGDSLKSEEVKAEVDNDNKKFDVFYNGENIQLDNSDGHLGYKTQEGLMKAVAHNNLHTKKVEGDYYSKLEENRILQERIRDLESKGNQQNSPTDQVTNPPVDIPVGVNVNYEALTSLSVDEDDTKNYGDFTESLKSTLDGFSSKINNLESESKKKDDIIKNLKEISDRDAVKREEQQYWDKTEQFRNKFGINSSNRTLSVIEPEVFQWKEQIARVYGIDRNNEYSSGQIDDIMNKWNNGDETVKNALNATNVPVGIEDYIKITDIDSELKRLKSNGVLGPNATYELVMNNRGVAQQQSNNHSSSHQEDNKDALHKSVTAGATKEQILAANADIDTNYATTFQGSETAVIPENKSEEHAQMMAELAVLVNNPDVDIKELAKNPKFEKFLKREFANEF